MNDALARRRFSAARVAHLATIDGAAPAGRPHVVPIVFVVAGQTVYSAVDAKPKRHLALQRLANVASNPAVSVLVDHYDDDDWTALWWVRADGIGRILAPADPEAVQAVDLLMGRYPGSTAPSDHPARSWRWTSGVGLPGRRRDAAPGLIGRDGRDSSLRGSPIRAALDPPFGGFPGA